MRYFHFIKKDEDIKHNMFQTVDMLSSYSSIYKCWSFEQVRLYDISAQRRPVLSFDFRETPIKALAEDIDGNTIYLGNGSGDMASVDIRTGIPQNFGNVS